MDGLTDLLDLIGYADGENVNLNYQKPGGAFASEVVAWDHSGDIEARALTRGEGCNVWFGVNPTRERPVDDNGRQKGRGTAEDVTRLAAIWCDLDVKGGACRDIPHAHQVIDGMSELLGTRPSAVVMSGHGLQPYWPIEDGQIEVPGADAGTVAVLRAEAAAVLKRWGRLACMVADNLGARIDRGVYDLPRVLRLPGSCNMKGDPVLVTIAADTGAPLTLDELRDRLDEAGVSEYEGDRRTSHEVISTPDAWKFAPGTCDYFAPTIAAWREEPITERHPWLTRQAVRIMAALRNGCLDAAKFDEAKKVVVERFLQACARDGRSVPDWEVPNAFAWAVAHVSTKTDGELMTEFGSHLHLWQKAEPRKIELAPIPHDPPAQQTPADSRRSISSTASGETLAEVIPMHDRSGAVAASATLTDTGNADMLVEAYGGRLRYCPDTGKWHRWDGTRWQRGADAGEALYAARKVIESIRADENSSPDLAKHKIRSLNLRGLSAMVTLASADPRMRVRLADLDAKPYELNTPSGIVDLKTGELRAHDPEGGHTKITGAGFDPTAPAQRWQAFLDGTFGGNAEMIEFVQRLAGLAATGKVTHHVLPFAFGGGSNGKSVIMDVFANVLGDYAITAPANFLLSGRDKHETEIARLHGARLVVCSEVNADSKFDEAKVKVLTGGDILSGRFMRQDLFDFVPSHTLFLMGNHQPRVSAGGTSFWRRLRLLPFTRTVPPEQRNPNLASELAGEEGAAVLAWIVAGAQKVAADGKLCEPESVIAATKEYGEQEDALGRFVEDCLDDLGGEVRTSKTDVQGAYARWCVVNGERQEPAIILGRELQTRGVEYADKGRRYLRASIRSGWRKGDVS